MYCSKCGAPNPDNSKFCNICGAALDAEKQNGDNQQSIYQQPMADQFSKMEPHCPRCKSKKIQTIDHFEMKGGYRPGKGVQGWHRRAFECTECGLRFFSIDDVLAKFKWSIFDVVGNLVGLVVIAVIIGVVAGQDIGVKALPILLLTEFCSVLYSVFFDSKKRTLQKEGYDAPSVNSELLELFRIPDQKK